MQMPQIAPNRRIATLGVLAAALVVIVACRDGAAEARKDPAMTPTTPTQPGARPATDAVVLTGTRVAGVSCPGLRLADGTEVALSHLPADLPLGARIEVTGSGYVFSMTCQARVLAVTSARPV
jgi:hypothetical protein